jgi:hypothetical protein
MSGHKNIPLCETVTKEQVAEFVDWHCNERKPATKKKPIEEAPNEVFKYLDDRMIVGEVFDWNEEGKLYKEAYKNVMEGRNAYYANECDGAYQAVYSKVKFSNLDHIEK